MSPLLFLISSILGATVICELFLIIYAHKRRSMPGAKYFICLLISMIIYNGAYIGEINSLTYTSAILWYKIEHIGSCIQIYFWVMMCVEYIRLKKKTVLIIKYIMMIQALLYYLEFFTNDIFHLYTKQFYFKSNGFFNVLVTEKGPYYYPMLLLCSHLALVTAIIYIRGICISPKSQRKGYLLMMIGSIFPWASGYFTVSEYNTLGIDYYPIFTFFTSLFQVLGIFRYNFFETMPIAIETVYRQSNAGILLLDINNQIIDANNAMGQLYPELKKITRGISFETFIQKYPEYRNAMDKQTQFEFQYNGEMGSIYFRADVKQIMTEDIYIGKFIKIVDITEIVEQKKLLQQVALIAIDKAEKNEISFLQAQINPHFINNTLSVIASMITRAPSDAKRLITELGEYLAHYYYFDSESPMVTLKKELETVQTYVNIKQARFGDRVKFELVAEDIPEVNIPRLILQPLVENAIRHGILKKAEGGKVYLIIKKWNSRLFFDIRDNGIGIDENYINNLISINHERKGIGLTNIHKRLIKYYQEGLTIKRIDVGTSVSFWIPIDNS